MAGIGPLPAIYGVVSISYIQPEADSKSTGCNGKPIVFQGHGRREVTASFEGGRFSPDGGALLLHEADKVFGVSRNAWLVGKIARQMRRSRVGSQTKSPFSAVAFRV